MLCYVFYIHLHVAFFTGRVDAGGAIASNLSPHPAPRFSHRKTFLLLLSNDVAAMVH